MHTEAEAIHLWCPMVRHEGEGASFNRGWHASNPLNATRQASFVCNCIASRCIAWRWAAAPTQDSIVCDTPLAHLEPPRPANIPSSWVFIPSICRTTLARWVAPEDERLRRGHCGLVTPPGPR